MALAISSALAMRPAGNCAALSLNIFSRTAALRRSHNGVFVRLGDTVLTRTGAKSANSVLGLLRVTHLTQMFSS